MIIVLNYKYSGFTQVNLHEITSHNTNIILFSMSYNAQAKWSGYV